MEGPETDTQARATGETQRRDGGSETQTRRDRDTDTGGRRRGRDRRSEVTVKTAEDMHQEVNQENKTQ